MEKKTVQLSSFSKNKYVKTVATCLVAVAIFGAGWLVGTGNISVQQYSAVGSNSDLPDQLDYSSVDTIYQSLKENFDGELDETKLMEGLKSGLASATGDPYTEYFNPDAADDFTAGLNGTFEGIGAQLGKNEDNNIIIISPIDGYPAQAAGLMPKDIVAEIDGESTDGLTISEAVEKIRGEKGTEVTLGIVRDGEFNEVKIVREEIDIPSVETEVRDGVGIITITRFGDDTVELARRAANEFRNQNVRGIVVDLRSNPGGYLDGAVDIASLWLESGATVVTERRDNTVIETLRASGDAPLKGIPTVVLINEGSASASEIVAGALRDNNAAELVGQKTFGKGSVQQPINLRDGGLLKITIARWFTPDGKNIDQEGIEPDEAVELTSEDITADRDPQLDAALNSLKD